MKKYFLISILLAYSSITEAQEIDARRQANKVPQQKSTELFSKKAKFVLTCSESNLSGIFQPVTNYLPGTHYREVTIDHRLCNNNPNAFILVTPVRWDPLSFTLYYDQNIQRWKIKINSSGVTESHKGHATPADKNPIVVTVLDYEPTHLKAGDKFNILIDNE